MWVVSDAAVQDWCRIMAVESAVWAFICAVGRLMLCLAVDAAVWVVLFTVAVAVGVAVRGAGAGGRCRGRRLAMCGPDIALTAGP